MSRRTSEASKAIREAWINEQQLVSKGKGTRDWTPEQQQSIMKDGKAYDDDRKAFIGHHMKSAEKYPEYQGDPENIQFLSYQEHLEAHNGNWRTPSNWYYDPVTGIKHEFGEEKYVPCKTIELSYALYPTPSTEPDAALEKETTPEQNPKDEPANRKNNVEQATDEKNKSTPPPYTPPIRHEPEEKGFWDKVTDFKDDVIEKVDDFHEDHPIMSEIGGFVLRSLIRKGGKVLLSQFRSKINEKKTMGHSSSTDHNFFDNLSNTHGSQGNSGPDLANLFDSSGAKNNPIERSSPIEHTVSSYIRKQNGKTVKVKPYKRGGNK